KSQISPLRQGFEGQANLKSQRFGNVFVYPTNTWFKLLYFFDAYRIAKEIIFQLPTTNYQLLITCQDPFETGLVGYLLKRKFSLPLQIQIHTDFLSPYFWKESIKNKIRVWLAKRLIKQADGIRVVSERIKESVVENCKLIIKNSAVAVLPIFVDTEKIKNAPIKTDLHQKYPSGFIILMASRLTKEKNISMALKAIRRLTLNNTQINAEKVLLLVVGDGPESKNLQLISLREMSRRGTTHNLQLENNVKFENAVPFELLISYYKTADLFLLTSNYEGYGRTAVEATAAGLPVLMTDVGVAVGSVVPVGDRVSLADRLELLIGNRSEREKVLEDQRMFLESCLSKESYLNQIKQLWLKCFS
ncbi:MAG: glycosyltransferase, partial [Patescibacteria group bacterium]